MEHADVWKAIALYLADCHAANGEYDAILASTSKNRRKRFANICKTAAELLEWKGTVPHASTTKLESVVKRLRRAIELCDEKDGKKSEPAPST